MKNIFWIFLKPLRVFLSIIFCLVGFLRNFLFDKGFGVKKVPCRILSVGNISVGGTGKTPCVIHYAKKYQSKGLKVAILSRGYKGIRSSGNICVSDGKKIHMSAREAGDEAFMMAKALKGIPVYVHKSRYFIAREVYKRHNVDLCILDDGFQHRFLDRDEDIVLWNACDEPLEQRLLPWGVLREPLSSLRRSSHLILTKSHLIDKDEVQGRLSDLSDYSSNVSVAKETPFEWVEHSTGKNFELSYLKGKRCVLFCALARPEGFIEMVKNLGVQVENVLLFRDHHIFTVKDEERIMLVQKQYNAHHIVCTWKDSVKLSERFPTFFLKNMFILNES